MSQIFMYIFQIFFLVMVMFNYANNNYDDTKINLMQEISEFNFPLLGMHGTHQSSSLPY